MDELRPSLYALLVVIATYTLPELLKWWRGRRKDASDAKNTDADTATKVVDAAGNLIDKAKNISEREEKLYDRQIAECHARIDQLTTDNEEMKLLVEYMKEQLEDLQKKFDEQARVLKNVQREFVKMREKYEHEHRRATAYYDTLSQHRIDIPTIK